MGEKFCINCFKEINRTKKPHHKYFCKKCYYKDYCKRNPHKIKEKHLKEKQQRRIKLGLPIDHPDLKRIGQPWKNKDGYIYVRKNNHPNSQKNGTIYQHILIMSEYLGRPLKINERVHHKNGIRDDNRIENLELWNKEQPYGQRVKDRIKYYKEFIESYGGKVDLTTVAYILDND